MNTTETRPTKNAVSPPKARPASLPIPERDGPIFSYMDGEPSQPTAGCGGSHSQETLLCPGVGTEPPRLVYRFVARPSRGLFPHRPFYRARCVVLGECRRPLSTSGDRRQLVPLVLWEARHPFIPTILADVARRLKFSGSNPGGTTHPSCNPRGGVAYARPVDAAVDATIRDDWTQCGLVHRQTLTPAGHAPAGHDPDAIGAPPGLCPQAEACPLYGCAAGSSPAGVFTPNVRIRVENGPRAGVTCGGWLNPNCEPQYKRDGVETSPGSGQAVRSHLLKDETQATERVVDPAFPPTSWSHPMIPIFALGILY